MELTCLGPGTVVWSPGDWEVSLGPQVGYRGLVSQPRTSGSSSRVSLSPSPLCLHGLLLSWFSARCQLCSSPSHGLPGGQLSGVTKAAGVFCHLAQSVPGSPVGPPASMHFWFYSWLVFTCADAGQATGSSHSHTGAAA